MKKKVGGQETHCMTGTVYHNLWKNIKQRCYNKNNSSYKNYGARGIKMHEPWFNDFQTFFDYIGEKPSENHSLDRINNEGNYEPGNVRWADRTTQNRNQRTRKDNKSKTKGVSFRKSMKKWVVYINYNKKRKHIGYYEDLSTAEAARKKAEEEYWGG
jgi:hypothetical protein